MKLDYSKTLNEQRDTIENILNENKHYSLQLSQLQQENEELKSKIKEVKAKVKDYVCTEEYCGYIGKVTTKFILDIKSILDKEGDK